MRERGMLMFGKRSKGEEEEKEDMDVQNIMSETQHVGKKLLESFYPYKCFRVDINDTKCYYWRFCYTQVLIQFPINGKI